MENKVPEFNNPIDPEKIAENPGLLPYAHHAGSALIKPEDANKLTTRALKSMEHQTTAQLRARCADHHRAAIQHQTVAAETQGPRQVGADSNIGL